MSWEAFAYKGHCQSCGVEGLVRIEPFGGQHHCQRCWEMVCYGEGEED